MSSEVETMAYAHEVPWHGQGQRVDDKTSTQEMLVAAGLDWQVEKVAVGCIDSPDPIPNRYAIRRATDRRVYSVVAEGWKPVQNSEILNFFRAWVDAGDATLETAGSLRNGTQVWALANLRNGFTLPGGDDVRGYVLMVGSHESGMATLIRTTTVRVVCANTMAVALSSKAQTEVRWHHSRDFDPEVARERLALSREAIFEFGRVAESLTHVRLSEDDAIRVLAPVYQPKVDVEDLVADHDLLIPTVQKIMWASKKAPGAVPDTAWGLLNGVTYYADHMVAGENRLHNSWLGYQARRKQEILDSLVALAA